MNKDEQIQTLKKTILGMYKEFDEITQLCGQALDYPWYKDDQKNFPGATEANGVCIGEHVPASIVAELVHAYLKLKNKGQVNDSQKDN